MNSAGVCLLTSGEGFLTITLVSASSVSSTATIPISVQANFALLQTSDKFFEPTLAGLTMSIAGNYPSSTSWAFDWAISIGSLVFGVEAAITPLSMPDVFLPYKADLNGTSLGLPLSLMRGSRVNLPISLQINGAHLVGRFGNFFFFSSDF